MHCCSTVHTGQQYARIWSLYSLQRQLVNSLNWQGSTCHCNLSPTLCTTQMQRSATFIWQCTRYTRTGNSYGRLFQKWTKWIKALVQSVTKGLQAHSTVKYFWSLHGNWPTCERMFRTLLWRKPPQRVELQHQSLLHPACRGHWDKPPQTLKYPNHRSPS